MPEGGERWGEERCSGRGEDCSLGYACSHSLHSLLSFIVLFESLHSPAPTSDPHAPLQCLSAAFPATSLPFLKALCSGQRDKAPQHGITSVPPCVRAAQSLSQGRCSASFLLQVSDRPGLNEKLLDLRAGETCGPAILRLVLWLLDLLTIRCAHFRICFSAFGFERLVHPSPVPRNEVHRCSGVLQAPESINKRICAFPLHRAREGESSMLSLPPSWAGACSLTATCSDEWQ